METINIIATSSDHLLFNAEYKYALGSYDKALELASLAYLLHPVSKAKAIELMQRCNQRLVVNQPTAPAATPKPVNTEIDVKPQEIKAEAPISADELNENDLIAKQILNANDLFDMLNRKPWDPIPELDKAFKKTIFSVHSDRNNSSLATSASSKLTEEIKKFRASPSAYTKKIEQERADRGIRDSGIDPLFDRDGYGKRPLDFGPNGEIIKEELDPLSGFDREGKRSYTWFAAAGPKRHVDCNPEAVTTEDPDGKGSSALYASKAGEDDWMGLLEYSDATAHKFSNKGKYQSFSDRGVSSSKHGTKFLAKNK